MIENKKAGLELLREPFPENQVKNYLLTSITAYDSLRT